MSSLGGSVVRRIVETLRSWGPVGIWVAMVLSAELVTFAVMTPLSIYFHGRLTDDYIVTGAVACLVSGGLVSAGVVWALGVYGRLDAERQALEEQLLEAHRHEAITHLAAGIAHDFNNLMVAVLGNASVLQGQLPDLPPELADDMGEALADIEQAGHTASELVRQLQVYARDSRLEHVPLDLSEVIGGVLSLLARSLHPRTRVVREVEPHLVVRGSESQLQQALMNLCINAADAMPEGGELRVVARREGSDPGEVVVEVSDEGPGIPAEVLARIFEPFFTTREDRGGTGMGLAVVHGVAGGHGGSVVAENRDGVGARFVLRLPASDRVLPQRFAPPTAEGPSAGRVLVVDDVAANRRLARRVLGRMGLEVDEAASGEAALARFEEQGADLVLLDLRMPGMDGEEVLDELRRRYGPALPVLVVSGHADAATRTRIAEAGACFLAKPYRHQPFVDAVLRAMGRED